MTACLREISMESIRRSELFSRPIYCLPKFKTNPLKGLGLISLLADSNRIRAALFDIFFDNCLKFNRFSHLIKTKLLENYRKQVITHM